MMRMRATATTTTTTTTTTTSRYSWLKIMQRSRRTIPEKEQLQSPLRGSDFVSITPVPCRVLTRSLGPRPCPVIYPIDSPCRACVGCDEVQFTISFFHALVTFIACTSPIDPVRLTVHYLEHVERTGITQTQYVAVIRFAEVTTQLQYKCCPAT